METITRKRVTFTILSLSLLTVMAGAAIAPALGTIKNHFSNESPLLVQLIVSIPSLFIVLANMLFPQLCKVMKTRALALLGLAIYILAGSGAYLVDNIWVILCLRAILGLSVGIIMPLSTGLLAYFYPPEKQAKLMGLSAFMCQMGGVIATFIAGFLAIISWNCAFLVYLFGLPVVVLAAIYTPNEQLKKSPRGQSSIRSTVKEYHPFIEGMFFVMTLFFIFPTNFSVIAQTNKSLNSEIITIIMVALDVVASLIGLAFGRLMRKFPRFIKYFPAIGFFCGYLFYALGTQLVWLILGSIVIGLANGIAVPYFNTVAAIKGGREAATTIMPLLSMGFFAGQFFSPLIVKPLAGLLHTLTAPYIIGCLIALLFFCHTLACRKFHTLPAGH